MCLVQINSSFLLLTGNPPTGGWNRTSAPRCCMFMRCVRVCVSECVCVADGCEDSFVHRDCISCCPPTCTFEKECLGTNLHCLDGCYCPDGVCVCVCVCVCVFTHVCVCVWVC